MLTENTVTKLQEMHLSAMAKVFTWGQMHGLDSHHHGSLVG